MTVVRFRVMTYAVGEEFVIRAACVGNYLAAARHRQPGIQRRAPQRGRLRTTSKIFFILSDGLPKTNVRLMSDCQPSTGPAIDQHQRTFGG